MRTRITVAAGAPAAGMPWTAYTRMLIAVIGTAVPGAMRSSSGWSAAESHSSSRALAPSGCGVVTRTSRGEPWKTTSTRE